MRLKSSSQIKWNNMGWLRLLHPLIATGLGWALNGTQLELFSFMGFLLIFVVLLVALIEHLITKAVMRKRSRDKYKIKMKGYF